MAHPTFFLFSLVTLTALHGICKCATDYAVFNRAETTPGGIRFKDELGDKYAFQTMAEASDFIWKLFKQDTEAERKVVPSVDLYIDDLRPIDVAYSTSGEIHIGDDYIQSINSCDIKPDFNGVLYHEMTHVWQWNGNGQAPGGLIEGIADFVRLRANYSQENWVKSGQGNNWDQGYSVTARFLDYCNGLRDGFVAELNRMMVYNYSDNFFVQLLGKTPDELFSEYKAKYAVYS